MAARRSSGSPYLVLAVFVAVALLSTGTLGCLAWQLLQQDAELELQRRHERLEQAADRAATGMQRALLEFQALVGSDLAPDQIPPGVSLLSIAHGRVTASPPGSLLYLPRSAVIRADAPAGSLAEGERLEFTDQKQNLRGALKVYSRYVRGPDPRVRAAALAGVARVHRKLGDEAEALAEYARLGDIDATVAGLHAGLLARAARASIYEASGDAVALQAEAAALQHDLAAGTRVARNGYVVELSCAASELPPIEADREALSRAIWNLLDNAVKYSPACRTVWVDLECDHRHVRLSIRDQGLGIPAEEQPRIFDRFVRGSESKARRITGTGIGLAMVRQIVQAHGGEVCVNSAPGQGSCFTIELKTTSYPPRRARPRSRRAPDTTRTAASGKPQTDCEGPEAGGSEQKVVA